MTHTPLLPLFYDLWYTLDPVGRLHRSGAKIGNNVFFGLHTFVELENARLLTIEDNAVISAHSKIILHDSSLSRIANVKPRYGTVILRKNCYIGANSTILYGSDIGENTIVGANSLVKGSLKPNSVYVGQPVQRLCSTQELQKKWGSDLLAKE